MTPIAKEIAHHGSDAYGKSRGKEYEDDKQCVDETGSRQLLSGMATNHERIGKVENNGTDITHHDGSAKLYYVFIMPYHNLKSGMHTGRIPD